MKVKLPKLELWQNDCFKEVKKNNGKWIVVKSRRLVGKSALLKALILYVSLNNKEANTILCSPVISQSRKIYEELAKMADTLILRQNGSTLKIEFINGSTVEFVSAELGTSIRGKTVKNGGLLLVDEAAFISDDFFYGVLVPTTNVFKATIVLTSSPFVKKGFFYELFTNNEDTIKIDWCNYDTSKYLSTEMLNTFRETLPKRIFQTEYLGEFADGDSYIFGDFKKNIYDNIHYTNGLTVFGVDWGTGSGKDYTVITVIEKKDDKIKVIRQLAFNDKGVEETIEEIEKLTNIYKPVNVLVELNSIGKIYYDFLKKKVKNCNTFLTTNESKNKIINNLSLLLEQEKLLLPNDKNLIAELSFFLSKVTQNNNITYSAPNGMNDDRVMSLAIGLWGMKSNNYTIR